MTRSVSKRPLSALVAVHPLAYIDAPIRPSHLALSLSLIIDIVALIPAPVRPRLNALSVPQRFVPRSLVRLAARPDILSMTLHQVARKAAIVVVAVGPEEAALPVALAGMVITDESRAVSRRGVGALAVRLVVLVLTLMHVTVAVERPSVPVPLVVGPVTLVNGPVGPDLLSFAMAGPGTDEPLASIFCPFLVNDGRSDLAFCLDLFLSHNFNELLWVIHSDLTSCGSVFVLITTLLLLPSKLLLFLLQAPLGPVSCLVLDRVFKLALGLLETSQVFLHPAFLPALAAILIVSDNHGPHLVKSHKELPHVII